MYSLKYENKPITCLICFLSHGGDIFCTAESRSGFGFRVPDPIICPTNFTCGKAKLHLARFNVIPDLLISDKNFSRCLKWERQAPEYTDMSSTYDVVIWPTTSCFADWSKCRHVTFLIVDCQEVVLTCYRIFITCHRRPLDMLKNVTRLGLDML